LLVLVPSPERRGADLRRSGAVVVAGSRSAGTDVLITATGMAAQFEPGRDIAAASERVMIPGRRIS